MTEKMQNLLLSNPDISMSADTGRGLVLRNPFIPASGTYGYGTEYSDLCPADDWGAVALKSVTFLPRKGNPLPRCCDTDSGMLNSIGLANVGPDKFLFEKMPEFTRRFPDAVAVSSIAGETLEEFISLASRIGNSPGVKVIELNISCPNVSKGGILFSADASTAAEVVKECRKTTKLPLWAKISPASADPAGIAAACTDAGADAIVASNAFPAMLIDIYKQAPVLGNKTGGLSGPAIFPASLRIAYIIAKAIPGIKLIGCGGIDCAEKAIQFILAGCSAVEIGAAMFRSPDILYSMTYGLKSYMNEMGFNSIEDFRGSALKP